MTYQGIVSNGVVVLTGAKPLEGTLVEVIPHTATDFWDSPSIEELAVAQDVQPIVDARLILGTWPGDPDDGFDAAIESLRHPTNPG